MGLALAGFFLAQRFGGAKLLDRGLMVLADRFGWSSLANLASLHDNLVRIYADVPRLALAMVVHIARLVRRRVRSAGGAAPDGLSR